MPTIKITDPKYIIAGKSIDRIDVGPINFLSYCAAGDAASRGAKTDKDVAKHLFRERVMRQAKAFTADGAAVAFDLPALMSLPLPYAMALKRAINADAEDAKSCKMLSQGDGMLTPLHIELGTPLKGSAGKEIAELEFQAQTLGQLEDFVAADGQVEKTIALLAIAKPVGGDMSLQALPSWAIDQISLPDGAWIMEKVVPSFLHESKDS